MKLTYLSSSFFPFDVPEKDSSFAASVGAQTIYPAGFSLDRVMQLYWRAQDYGISATGGGVLGGLTQALSASGNIPPRNAAVGTGSFSLLTGFTPTGPGDLVTGRGLRQVVAGSGTITAETDDGSGTNTGGVFDLQINLFYPEIFAPDPIVKYDGLYWPALSLTCSVTNSVTLDGGGSLGMSYDCSTLADGVSTYALGSFSFFGVSVPVYCQPLAPASGPDAAETRSFSGSLIVASEWP